MTPALTRSSYSSVAALKPKAPLPFLTFSTTIEPSTPAFCGDLAQRLLERAADDVDAVLPVVVELQAVERRQRAEQRHAAAGDDALFDGRAGRVQRVLDAGLLLLHLDSVAAPTLITATPPTSLARRSCSFSRS